mmetsp:Transcript_18810/g.48295  ORF Transcript_18810/g.48295 Transcript_18810/m.48295 type:complete len:345 (-) Transcript_18810:3-1037(-)
MHVHGLGFGHLLLPAAGGGTAVGVGEEVAAAASDGEVAVLAPGRMGSGIVALCEGIVRKPAGGGGGLGRRGDAGACLLGNRCLLRGLLKQAVVRLGGHLLHAQAMLALGGVLLCQDATCGLAWRRLGRRGPGRGRLRRRHSGGGGRRHGLGPRRRGGCDLRHQGRRGRQRLLCSFDGRQGGTLAVFQPLLGLTCQGLAVHLGCTRGVLRLNLVGARAVPAMLLEECAGTAIAADGHQPQLVLRPRVQRGGPHKADVHAQAAVHARAGQADVDAVWDGGPRGVLCRAVKADLVLRLGAHLPEQDIPVQRGSGVHDQCHRLRRHGGDAQPDERSTDRKGIRGGRGG